MKSAQIRKLCDKYDFVWATHRVVKGAPVTWMLRKEPNEALPSSGWLFLSRHDERGVESAEEIEMITLERVLIHSPRVAEHLHLPAGSQLSIQPDGSFSQVR